MLLQRDMRRPLRETFHALVAGRLVARQLETRVIEARVDLVDAAVVLQASIQAVDLLPAFRTKGVVFNRLLVGVRVIGIVDEAFHVLAVLIAHPLAAKRHQRIAARQLEAARVVDVDRIGAVGRVGVDEVGQRFRHVFLLATAAAGRHIEVDQFGERRVVVLHVVIVAADIAARKGVAVIARRQFQRVEVAQSEVQLEQLRLRFLLIVTVVAEAEFLAVRATAVLVVVADHARARGRHETHAAAVEGGVFHAHGQHGAAPHAIVACGHFRARARRFTGKDDIIDADGAEIGAAAQRIDAIAAHRIAARHVHADDEVRIDQGAELAAGHAAMRHFRWRAAIVILRHAIDHGVDPAKAGQATDIDADGSLCRIDLRKRARHAAQDLIDGLQSRVRAARAEGSRLFQRLLFHRYAVAGHIQWRKFHLASFLCLLRPSLLRQQRHADAHGSCHCLDMHTPSICYGKNFNKQRSASSCLVLSCFQLERDGQGDCHRALVQDVVGWRRQRLRALQHLQRFAVEQHRA